MLSSLSSLEEGEKFLLVVYHFLQDEVRIYYGTGFVPY
jgi:hypothetical protein